MSKKPVITAAEAAAWVQDGMTITTSGFVASCMPEALTKALEQRFVETGAPKALTLFYAAAQGNRDGSGADHFAHEGMTKRVIGGHWNMVPELGKLVMENKIEAYNLPQGTLSQLYRDIAGHRLGTLTHVGLNTFADPRVEGGKLNAITTEDIVEVVEVCGQERLLYKAQHFDIGFIRGTYADENGNVTLEHEVASLEATSIAQAVKNCGGKVVVQVEKVVADGALDPKLVKIPGIYVDAIVVCENKEDHAQCVGCAYDGSMSGEFRVPLSSLEYPPLSAKKIIGRRAALELQPDKVVNLGIGIPEYISMVANEEGIGDYMTLTVEAGPVGGVPQGGPKFGGSVNVEAILDQPYQFDFYDGGGVDLAFLGLAQADRKGNINVSKFGPRIAGCGGFINITQNAKRVYFCGTFTAGGLKTAVQDGKLVILQEGREKKLIDTVEQITFSGDYAVKTGQPVMYITERAVFELRADGVYLTEIAPGIDLQTQVLDLMGFTPKMDGAPKLMDARIFSDALMGLK
ncbi:3-oxoacid CoA-transferase [Pseudoflavonifractor phocaeensis]|uniref:acyl CoA:acetate/3-ketoacid CoA transferase n=1 Tax=Pseudoflavonifractor phocaeensis TaxID=1870988 RepID=UPI001956FEDF|nr:CoA-transferase [Pseudoflavonifractor phocaeensis]MBM6939614.1 3-oxoacid CoA-transferase [Pseudoflavonifractor phocaeensis]